MTRPIAGSGFFIAALSQISTCGYYYTFSSRKLISLLITSKKRNVWKQCKRWQTISEEL